jgi:hypothetical protein
MIAKCLCAASLLTLVSHSAFAAESWTCTYPAFRVPGGSAAAARTITRPFVVSGDKLIGGVKYDIIENNQYGLIAVEHYSEFDGGVVRIFSSTVIIDKTFGKFIFTVGEIGDEPQYRTGHCAKDEK